MPLHIIHTADWHLGQTFFGYDRDAEQEAFLFWLIDTVSERQTDVLLIAGDVFDVANPSALAQRRFYHFLKEVNRRNPELQILVIAGNHDSAVRLEAPNPLLEELNTKIVGLVSRTDLGQIEWDSLLYPLYERETKRCRAWCLAVPYLRQGDYPATEEANDTYVAGIRRMYQQLKAYAASRCEADECLVAMGHLHASGAELSDDDRSERAILGGLESVSADAFDGLDYTALGHIHKAQRVGGRETVRYAGSPIPMSFSETNYRHQVIEVTLDDSGTISIASLPVPVLAELKRIPEQPALPEEVLKALSVLPDANELERNRWPYVEVRVLMTEPDPGFRHRVEEVLEGKAVRLTSIVPSYPKRIDEAEVKNLSYNDLQKIDPLDMLRHTFASRYGGELPEEIAQLFNDVMKEVSL